MSDWILVIDDDVTNLKMASKIMVAENLRVSCVKSGEDAIKFLQENIPDLILLDVHMPVMDGFQTITEIKRMENLAKVPVIFLTADEDSDTELKGLQLGAMDFIKKPFVPEVLLMRVRHTIDLIRLQTDLSREVAKKTQEISAQHERIERMTMQIVTALSGAIDAKDTYTNGHSARVAEYSAKIAKIAGLPESLQNDIYMMGLLHDVGKIGVPDAIINKPTSLSDEEYSIIMNHPVLGARILKSISEFPKMVTGARWHHERYDGTGYPDGLAGENIPLEARIIAVADSYDAMSSRRSYRDILPQQKVREELINGRGKQFDPVFADIMLKLMSGDPDYQMREK